MNRRTFFAGLFALPAAVKSVSNMVPHPKDFRWRPGANRSVDVDKMSGCTLTVAKITGLTPDDIIALGESEQRITSALREALPGHMRIRDGLYERYDGSAWRTML